MRAWRGFSAAAVALALCAGPAVADTYAYGDTYAEANGFAEGVLANGTRFVVYYRDPAGARHDTRYLEPVNQGVPGAVTVCVERRVSNRRVLADCAHAPLTAATYDKLHLSGATVSFRARSATKSGSTVTASITMKAAAAASLQPVAGQPEVHPGILAVGAGVRVTRQREQTVTGSIHSSWLGGGELRRSENAMLWVHAGTGQRVVGNCYDRYCD